MAGGERAIKLLEEIRDGIRQVVEALERGGHTGAPVAPLVASDRDLDGDYGDPVLRTPPRDWSSANGNFAGKRYSECPPELLDLIAERHDYFADKARDTDEMTKKGKPVEPYQRMDAARARGWAKRQRDGGWTPPVAARKPTFKRNDEPVVLPPSDDDISF